jgi:hypothetical protein
MKGIEESHFTSFYFSFCWLCIFIEEDNLYMLLYLQETGLKQLDEWYSWCGLQHTFDLIPYYKLDLLYVWSSIDTYIVHTVEALDIVDSLIDQSISLCFVGLYLLPIAAFLHRQLFMTGSSLLCSWLLSIVIYGFDKLLSLLLGVQYKTALLSFLDSVIV